jgi:hypothetical protein
VFQRSKGFPAALTKGALPGTPPVPLTPSRRVPSGAVLGDRSYVRPVSEKFDEVSCCSASALPSRIQPSAKELC